MGVIGVSLIVASVVYLCVFPQPWLRYFQSLWRHPAIEGPAAPRIIQEKQDDSEQNVIKPSIANGHTDKSRTSKAERDRAAMPPPPPIIRKANGNANVSIKEPDDEQTTPKAKPSQPIAAVPTFSLSESGPDKPKPSSLPMFPAPFSAQRASSGAGLMAPPRLPALSPLRASPTAPNRLPIPNRGPPTAASLTPPPTHSSKPTKPSRKVILTPGHSPMDWAAISGPNADLRNLPPSTPYLKVTPSMLRKMTGRKGKDAWTSLDRHVYNISPYLPFHPGGEPELLRCAGREGDKLFGEIHPWVNYKTMLAASLVGIMVDEHEEVNKMEEMD